MRATHVYKGLLQENLIQSSSVLQPEPIEEIHLRLVHDPKYLAQAKRDIKEGLKTLTTGDTSVSQDSWSVAMRASGSACLAVNELFSGKISRAFCVCRPPGHHATPALGMEENLKAWSGEPTFIMIGVLVLGRSARSVFSTS